MNKELIEKLEAEKKHRVTVNKIQTLFPDDGPLRRELYAKHLHFFALGAVEKERMFMAANRVGKTVAGAYECACHLTGEYPDWWSGYRFHEPVEIWAAGDTSETTRDVIQQEMLGFSGESGDEGFGTGMIPKKRLVGKPTFKRGVANAADTQTIRHKTGGLSKLAFKSYDQGRKKFQGTKKHVIWLDEEPPIDVYSECLLRTMTTNGLLMVTMTPLQGLSDVAIKFMPEMAEQAVAYSPDVESEALIAASASGMMEGTRDAVEDGALSELMGDDEGEVVGEVRFGT